MWKCKKKKKKFLQWPLEAGSESINRKVLTKDSSVKMPNSTSLNSIGVFVGGFMFWSEKPFWFPPLQISLYKSLNWSLCCWFLWSISMDQYL